MAIYRKHSNALYREVLVAGTLGAFFVAIAQTICEDVEAWFVPHVFALPYAAMRPLCYGYVFWFLVYFYYSTLWTKLDPQPLKCRDRMFYAIQSMSSLAAVFSLGLLADRHGHSDSAIPFVIANLAVAVICIASLACFGTRDAAEAQTRRAAQGARSTGSDNDRPELNHLRATGALIGLMDIGGILVLNPDRSSMDHAYLPAIILITTTQAAQWYVLLEFRLFTIRWAA